MKKLAYIITSSDWGGAQHYVFDLAKSLKEEFEVLICAGLNNKKIDGLLDKAEKMDIKTYTFTNIVRKINIIKDIKALFEIAIFYNIEKPDIVHLNSSKAGILGSLAKILSSYKPKIIYTVHGWVFTEPMNIFKKRLYICLEKLASKFRDQIIVLSDSEKQIALDYKICKENKLVIIKNAISTIDFYNKSVAKELLGLPKDKIIIGTISNYYKTKGLKYLVQAGLQLKDFYFVIIGDGPEKEGITASKNIKLLGYMPDASKYLYAFDVFVLSSLKEGYPYVITEAMYAGLPIVATKVGAIEEILKNYKNKILINPGDTKYLKDALIKIDKKLEIPIDEGGIKINFANFDNFIKETKKLYNTGSK